METITVSDWPSPPWAFTIAPVDVLTRLNMLERCPLDIDTALDGRDETSLRARPAHRAWSATEIICHLRDVEELFELRFRTIVALDEPPILVFGATLTNLAPWRITDLAEHPLNPDRWAEDRQYARNDPHDALAAFARRRRIVVGLLRSLAPADWSRRGVHLREGALMLLDWVARLAAHDANHVAQLRRALDGLV